MRRVVSAPRLVKAPFPRRSYATVVVIGGGQMGSGIAQISAAAGHKVIVADQNESILTKSSSFIRSSLERVAKKTHEQPEAAAGYVKSVMQNITTTVDTNNAVQSADLVIEAIVEDISVKSELFSAIDKVAPPTTIFASNTSSLSIDTIANATQRADRFGGLHFFNPPAVMKLVEVVRGPRTSETTHNFLMEFGKGIGKTTVATTDTPGFVVNRLLVPYLAESIRMLERGVATKEDIDNAMKLGAGYPMGPLTLCDYVGLDTLKLILDGWSKEYPNDPLFQPIQTLDKLVNAGKLGKKSGEGFYKY